MHAFFFVVDGECFFCLLAAAVLAKALELPVHEQIGVFVLRIQPDRSQMAGSEWRILEYILRHDSIAFLEQTMLKSVIANKVELVAGAQSFI